MTVWGTGKVSFRGQERYTRQGPTLKRGDDTLYLGADRLWVPASHISSSYSNKKGLGHGDHEKKHYVLRGAHAEQGSCGGDSGSPITQVQEGVEKLVGMVVEAKSSDLKNFAKRRGTFNALACNDVIFSPRLPLYLDKIKSHLRPPISQPVD